MVIKEVELTDEIIGQLIALSNDWEKENSCHGYRKNTADDINGNRVFIAVEEGDIIGYLFGNIKPAESGNSIHKAGVRIFELEELYVKPHMRSGGVGRELFRYVERAVSEEAEMIMLSTATKNFRAIMHFYIDELGMEFWSARLFKRIR